jgi:hypothetical protein
MIAAHVVGSVEHTHDLVSVDLIIDDLDLTLLIRREVWKLGGIEIIAQNTSKQMSLKVREKALNKTLFIHCISYTVLSTCLESWVVLERSSGNCGETDWVANIG